MTTMGRPGITIEIGADTKPFRRGVDEVDAVVDDLAETGRVGRKLVRFGSLVAGAFAVDALIGFGREMLTLGAQIETLNVKVDTVFGDQSAMIREWADGINESFGLTDTQVAGLAANMADLLKPMGFTSEQAATMSRESLELAGALSAWSGGTRSTAEVSEILSSALLGEYEQLKSLGISIDAAEVQTRALALAQAEGSDEVTGMHEALAVQALILEKSTDAQTAWNDGSMDAIKTQNELKAAFAEVREEIASRLYPIFTKIGEWIVDSFIPWIENDLIPALRDMEKWFRDNILPVLEDVWSYLADTLIPELVKFAETLSEDIVGAAEEVWGAVQEFLLPALDGFNSQMSDSLGVSSGFATDIGVHFALISGIVRLHMAYSREAVELFVRVLGTAVESISVSVDLIGQAFSGIGNAVSGGFQAAYQRVIRFLSLIVDAWNALDVSIPSLNVSVGGRTIGTGGGGDLFPDVPNPFGAGGGKVATGIPKLAAGGIVTAPTLALIGEAGPEAVIPLSGRHGGVGTNITMHVTVADGRDLVYQLRQYERTSGRVFAGAA